MRRSFSAYLAFPVVMVLALAGFMYTVAIPPAAGNVPLARKQEPPTLPQPEPFSPGPAKGRFLVADRDMRDPRFQETVILLIRYDREGALGLIINRPSDVRLSTMFPEIKGLKKGTHHVYYGGPVAGHQMLILVRSAQKPGESLKVLDGVYVSSSRELLEQMAREGRSEKRYRVYAGYAGWAAGQLDGELARGDWHMARGDVKSIFEKDPDAVWEELIRKSAVIHVRSTQGGASLTP